MLFTIVPSTLENVPPGAYQADFVGITPLETKNGKALRWAFRASDGRNLSGISDNEKHPTTKNKTGRWLSALSGKPLEAGVQINPDDYVGKKYLCVFADNGNGGTRLETFSRVVS